MKFIETKNLTKRFNDKLVIDNVSLGIEKGEIFGLLGPNGAGKSTLINLMVGILKIDRGEVVIGGIQHIKGTFKGKGKNRASSARNSSF